MLKGPFLLLIILFSSNIFAQGNNNTDTKIDIQSDAYEMFSRENQSGYILKHNVRVKNSEIDIEADRAEILADQSGTMQSAVFTGTPVRCKTKGLKEQQLDTTSDEVHYLEDKGIIIFKGHVIIKRENSTFEGPEFVYNLKDKTLNGVERAGERFHLELTGKKQ